MKSFDKIAAQGDMMLIKIDRLPDDARLKMAENGLHILTHSESGHHHIVMDRPTVKFFSATDEFRSYLVVENEPAVLEHLRPTDTHESLEIKPGIYEVRRQREYSPAGWQRAAD